MHADKGLCRRGAIQPASRTTMDTNYLALDYVPGQHVNLPDLPADGFLVQNNC